MKNKIITILLIVIIILLSCVIIDKTNCMVYAEENKVTDYKTEQRVVAYNHMECDYVKDELTKQIENGWSIKETTVVYDNHYCSVDWLIILERKVEDNEE